MIASLLIFLSNPHSTLQWEWLCKDKTVHFTVRWQPLFSLYCCLFSPCLLPMHATVLYSRLTAIQQSCPPGVKTKQNIDRNLICTLGPYVAYSFSLSSLPPKLYTVTFISFRKDLSSHLLMRSFLTILSKGTIITTHNTLFLAHGFEQYLKFSCLVIWLLVHYMPSPSECKTQDS